MLLKRLLMNSSIICSSNSNLSFQTQKYKEEKYIIKNFLNDSINMNINEGSKTHVIYFSHKAEKVSINAKLDAYSELNIDIILLGQDANNTYLFDLLGSEANLNVRILSLAKNCKKDFDITVNHLAKYTKSKVSNYGISFENGHNNFNVIGKIEGNMTGSDVSQITKGLILSPSGECLAKPILLIDYYDVKAYHGASIGKVNDDDLFYLMSRGLTKNEAYMLVINGLLEPFITDDLDEETKNEIISSYKKYFD